jgi:hypothetical protein
MHIADMPSVPELLKQQESENRIRDVKNIFADRMAQASSVASSGSASAMPSVLTITTSEQLASALQDNKEILLYSYYSSNIEISEFSDGCIKYFDRKGDGDFAHKLSSWLSEKTGKNWVLTKMTESVNAQTVSEQKHEELVADPLVASAISLFENAEIVGVK